MKLLKKSSLLFAIVGLSICSCSLEKRCECLESSDSLEYADGMCYQVSRSNIVESFFIINNPIDSENANGPKYDIIWSETIRLENFSCVDGLAGKHIMNIFRIRDNILKITVDGSITDETATYGYIRILPNAFTAYTERATDSVLYAYIAIGSTSSLVNKPNQ